MEIISPRSSRAQATNVKLHDHFLFTPTAFFTWGLAASYYMVEYACVSIIITFYTEKAMENKLADAAILVCVQEGLTSFAAVVLARFTGERSGRRFYAIVLSTALYIAGVIILWSYANYTSHQKPENQEHNVPLFWVVSCLLAIGKGVSDPVLKSFLEHNLCASSAERTSLTKREEIYKNIWVHSTWIVGAIIAIFGFLGLEWPPVLKVSLIVIVPSSLLFLFGGSTSTTKPMGRCVSLHKNATTVTKRGRNMKWLLMFSCTAYSLVLGAGNIFFQEQGTKMKDLKIKKKKVRFSFMTVIKVAVNEITVLIFWLCGANKKQGISLLRIGSGMVCAIICCVVAWKVEIDRNKVANEEDSNKTSVAWLSPHYVLLGLVEGLAQSGLEELFGNDNENQTMRNPGKISKDMVSCVGKFLGIPCILIVRRWFDKFDEDQAHLDRFYLMLGILSCVFFCIYLGVAFVYMKVNNVSSDAEDEGNNDISNRVHVEST
ncbi:hypothetical protein QN277_023508 [Acacia crassicarpa]|uniref:Uncharacterized protein n=1 Tax=Acacia crassicarpa TaxID=499986 RepID=A0AAE1MN34_9FABA|nr:hypothetical protein QN277_023508 [Acacia crassicarpa]